MAFALVAILAAGAGCDIDGGCVPGLSPALRVHVTRCSTPVEAQVVARDGTYVEHLTARCDWDDASCGDYAGIIGRPGHYTVEVSAFDTTLTIDDAVLVEGVCGLVEISLLADLSPGADGCATADGRRSEASLPDATSMPESPVDVEGAK